MGVPKDLLFQKMQKSSFLKDGGHTLSKKYSMVKSQWQSQKILFWGGAKELERW